MVTRGFTGRNSGGDQPDRIPPGQHPVEHFPVLSEGPTPRVETADWRFTLKYQKPGRVPKNLSWVHPGFGVTLASHETSKDPRRWSMRPDRVQIEPAGVTAGKSFSGSNTLLKKFVREYMATSATISMTFASV
jgi:hypothetical protein